MALLQGFWFGTAVLEPMEVAPTLPPRDYDAASATPSKYSTNTCY